MDIIYHGLIGLTVSKVVTGHFVPEAAIAGMLPDAGAVPYGYFAITQAFKKHPNRLLSNLAKISSKGHFFTYLDKITYRATHSLVIWVAVSYLFYHLFNQYWFVLSLSYLLHIFIDMLTHHNQLSLRLFYPFADTQIEGIDWYSHIPVFISFWAIPLKLPFKIIGSIAFISSTNGELSGKGFSAKMGLPKTWAKPISKKVFAPI